MKRSLWVIFGILVLLAAAVLLDVGRRDDTEFDAPNDGVPLSASPPASLPDVRVRHEFVTISTTPVNWQRAARPPATARPSTDALRTPAPAQPPPAPAVARAGEDLGLLERAGRAVIGDGRYRPEPFPRIKRN